MKHPCSERLQYSYIWKKQSKLVSNGTMCFQKCGLYDITPLQQVHELQIARFIREELTTEHHQNHAQWRPAATFAKWPLSEQLQHYIEITRPETKSNETQEQNLVGYNIYIRSTSWWHTSNRARLSPDMRVTSTTLNSSPQLMLPSAQRAW